MKYILLLCLFIAGCCPKISDQITIQRDTTTIYKTDTITIPEIREVYVSNIKQLCDSINKLTSSKQKIIYKIPSTNNANANLTISVDSLHNAEFISTISNYQHIQDSLLQVIKITENKNTTQIVNRCTSKFHIFAVWMLFLVVLCVALYIVTRK